MKPPRFRPHWRGNNSQIPQPARSRVSREWHKFKRHFGHWKTASRSAKGAISYQPGATPQEQPNHQAGALKARIILPCPIRELHLRARMDIVDSILESECDQTNDLPRCSTEYASSRQPGCRLSCRKLLELQICSFNLGCRRRCARLHLLVKSHSSTPSSILSKLDVWPTTQIGRNFFCFAPIFHPASETDFCASFRHCYSCGLLSDLR